MVLYNLITNKCLAPSEKKELFSLTMFPRIKLLEAWRCEGKKTVFHQTRNQVLRDTP